ERLREQRAPGREQQRRPERAQREQGEPAQSEHCPRERGVEGCSPIHARLLRMHVSRRHGALRKLAQRRKAGPMPPDLALTFEIPAARSFGLCGVSAAPFRHWAERIAPIVAKWPSSRAWGCGSCRGFPVRAEFTSHGEGRRVQRCPRNHPLGNDAQSRRIQWWCTVAHVLQRRTPKGVPECPSRLSRSLCSREVPSPRPPSCSPLHGGPTLRA